MEKIRKLFLTCSVILMLSACSILQSPSAPSGSSDFTFSVLKIGKADAIIMHTQHHTLLIDCGEEEDGEEVAEYLEAKGINKVDYLFITHFDKDHVGGAEEIIDEISIGQIITPDYEGANEAYQEYRQAVREHKLTPVALREDMSFTLDQVLFEVYPPQEVAYSEGDNDFSLAISVTHGENTFLFAGDAEEERLSEILSRTNQAYDFLKVPHHGKYNDMTKKFIEGIHPAYAVITASDKNPPEEAVLRILNDIGSKTYITKDGDITVISDGKQIQIVQ